VPRRRWYQARPARRAAAVARDITLSELDPAARMREHPASRSAGAAPHMRTSILLLAALLLLAVVL
jgi:hypothetical protein